MFEKAYSAIECLFLVLWQQEYEAASGNWEFSSYTGYSGSILLHTQLQGSAHSNPGPGIPGRESQLSILLRSLAVQGSGR